MFKKILFFFCTLIIILIVLTACSADDGPANIIENGTVEDNGANNEVIEDNNEKYVELDRVEGWEMVSTSEQRISGDTVTEMFNIKKDYSVEEIEDFLQRHAEQTKEGYPDHKIHLQALRDGELLAEIELE